mgnify:CR=1 FL=1
MSDYDDLDDTYPCGDDVYDEEECREMYEEYGDDACGDEEPYDEEDVGCPEDEWAEEEQTN